MCDESEHAHQKAIIHRDLKPSKYPSSMLQDDKPTVKVDPLCAPKALNQKLIQDVLLKPVRCWNARVHGALSRHGRLSISIREPMSYSLGRALTSC